MIGNFFEPRRYLRGLFSLAREALNKPPLARRRLQNGVPVENTREMLGMNCGKYGNLGGVARNQKSKIPSGM
jgi:hypothetical protein